jgi:hypothetical protein
MEDHLRFIVDLHLIANPEAKKCLRDLGAELVSQPSRYDLSAQTAHTASGSRETDAEKRSSLNTPAEQAATEINNDAVNRLLSLLHNPTGKIAFSPLQESFDQGELLDELHQLVGQQALLRWLKTVPKRDRINASTATLMVRLWRHLGNLPRLGACRVALRRFSTPFPMPQLLREAIDADLQERAYWNALPLEEPITTQHAQRFIQHLKGLPPSPSTNNRSSSAVADERCATDKIKCVRKQHAQAQALVE